MSFYMRLQQHIFRSDIQEKTEVEECTSLTCSRSIRCWRHHFYHFYFRRVCNLTTLKLHENITYKENYHRVSSYYMRPIFSSHDIFYGTMKIGRRNRPISSFVWVQPESTAHQTLHTLNLLRVKKTDRRPGQFSYITEQSIITSKWIEDNQRIT